MAKRCLRYLKETTANGLTFYANGPDTTIGYCDGDHGSGEDGKSIMGYVFLFKGSAISWQAKKQNTVSLSSTEAEYGALTQASKEVLWLQKLFKDLKREEYAPQILYSDNQGAIALANNPQFHARTKHIDIQVHFIRQCVNDGPIALNYCPTEEMIADILTKALGKQKHEGFVEMLGMESASPSPAKDQQKARAWKASGSVEVAPPKPLPSHLA